MSTQESFSKALREFTEVFMHRSMRDFKHFMDDSGLSASQLTTLMRLYHHGDSDVGDIGSSMSITNAASSQLVDRLVNQGLLVRAENPHDRRVKQITISQKGRLLIEEGINARMAWLEELTTALTPDEQAATIETLTLLTQAARKLDPLCTHVEQAPLAQPASAINIS